MTRSESASITVSRRGSTPDGGDPAYTVVWVRGEHDIATRMALVVAIARAAQRGDANVIVDLSEVTFMDASTIGALVGSRNRLRPRSRSLHVRAPSLPALRVLELCDLADLLHPATVTVHRTGVASALGTWVDVPATRSSRAIADESEPSEQRQPARSTPGGADARLPWASATIEVDRGGR